MTYSLELGPDGNPNVTFDESDLVSVDIAKPHTALADFDAEVPYDRDLRDRILDKVRIFAGDALLFQGYLRELDWDQKRGVTRLSGPGIGDDLRDSAIERSWTNVATHEAINDVWENNTDFLSTTVRDPDTSVVASDEVLIDASTTSELQALIDDPTAPITVQNGELRLGQSCYINWDDFGTGEYADDQFSGTIDFDDGRVTRGDLGGQFGSSGDRLSVNFTPEYTIPADHVAVGWRWIPVDEDGDGDVDNHVGIEHRVNGNVVQGFVDGFGTFDPGEPRWYQNENGYDGGDLKAGTTYTYEIVATSDGGSNYDSYGSGLMVVYDDRFSYNFDNTVSTTGDGTTGDENYLDGPELFPDGFTYVFPQLDPDLNVVGIGLTSSGWPDTTGAQRVGVSFDGGGTWFDNDNATSVDEDKPSNVGGTVDYRVTLDRYGSGQQVTPDQGYLGQKFDSITVDYDGSDLSIIQDDTFRGSPLKILVDLCERADYRFVIDHGAMTGDDAEKVSESFQRGTETKPKDWSTVNRRPSLSFVGYANDVTIYGALSGDGSRPKVTVQDDGEVAAYGSEPYFEIRPDLTTVDQVRAAAIDTLRSKVKQRDQKGSIEALPTDIPPGFSYPVDWFADGNPVETPMERVSISEDAGRMRADLEFVIPDDVTETVIDQGRAVDVTREGI